MLIFNRDGRERSFRQLFPNLKDRVVLCRLAAEATGTGQGVARGIVPGSSEAGPGMIRAECQAGHSLPAYLRVETATRIISGTQPPLGSMEPVSD